MAMFSCRTEEHRPLLGARGMDIFFVLNCVNVLVCLVCSTQRRVKLRASLRPMNPAWASLTFPLVSSCYVALYYANEYQLSGNTWTVWASKGWSLVIVPLTLLLVPCIDLAWMLHLPNWFFFNPPPRIDSIEGLDELASLTSDAAAQIEMLEACQTALVSASTSEENVCRGAASSGS
jgi:hypothetical protein